MGREGREGKGERGKEGKKEGGGGRKGRGKVVSWLLGDGRPWARVRNYHVCSVDMFSFATRYDILRNVQAEIIQLPHVAKTKNDEKQR